jgi:energy-coupling factor transport system permease protein
MTHSLFVQTIIAYLLIFAVPMLLPVAFLKLVGLSGLRTLVTYEARDTPLHRLDPRLKVLYPVGMGILSILFTWKFMLIVFGLTILPWFWLRPSRAKIRVLMVMIIGPAIAGFWGQGMYYLPPRPSTSSTSSRGLWPGSDRPGSPPTAWSSGSSRPRGCW